MPRKTFPCDIRTAHALQNKRDEYQTQHEVPHKNMERFMPSTTLTNLPFDFDKLMAVVARIHPRASSWVQAQLEGLSNNEIAQEWAVSPPCVCQWFDRYGRQIQAVFAEYLDVPGFPATMQKPKEPSERKAPKTARRKTTEIQKFRSEAVAAAVAKLRETNKRRRERLAA
jgi:hypothetical protein